MELSIISPPLPLHKDTNDIIRVGGTRVTLQTVITAFKDGSTCEEIIYQYPSLKLADVYTVISYYLTNQAEVEVYLENHRKRAENVRKKIESNLDSQSIRERLMKRSVVKND